MFGLSDELINLLSLFLLWLFVPWLSLMAVQQRGSEGMCDALVAPGCRDCSAAVGAMLGTG